jgi:hypothetical protein
VSLEHSPPDTRIVVFGSSAFVSDDALGLAQQMHSDFARSNLELVHNAVDLVARCRMVAPLQGERDRPRMADSCRRRWGELSGGVAACHARGTDRGAASC